MEQLKFVNITGKKKQTGEFGEVVITTSTPGQFRMSLKVAEKLGIVDGDNLVAVMPAGALDRVFIGKGITGEKLLDENGKVIIDKRGREVVKENTAFGATCRQSGAVISFSVADAWERIGGNTEEVKSFTIGEGIETEIETTLSDENGAVMHPTTVFELIFKDSKPKSVRGKRAEGAEAQDLEDVNFEEEEGFEEEEI